MISRIRTGLAAKLQDKGYRHRFFQRRAQDEIASNIRELRERRKLRQADLAEQCSMKQSAVSRIEQASYASWSLKTLFRVSEALDVRLRVVFDPMEEVIKQYERQEQIENTQVIAPETYTLQGKHQDNKPEAFRTDIAGIAAALMTPMPRQPHVEWGAATYKTGLAQ